MSGLFSTLTSAARSLDAMRFGLDVVGQNIANVNTAGFTRRTIDFAAIRPVSPLSAGGGVQVLGVRAIRDALLDRRLQLELPLGEKQAAIAQALSTVEVALGDPGKSIDLQLAKFFDAWATLAEDPTAATARQQVTVQGQSLAAGFRDMVERLRLAQRDADSRLRGAVDGVNALTARIASLNDAIATTGGTDALTLQDEQAEAIRALAGLVDITVMAREDGGADVTFGSGRPLVIGDSSYALVATPTGPSGLSVITSQGVNVQGEITSGTIGGLLQVRDAQIPDYLDRLDTIAYTLVQEVNALHQTGYDLNGNAGGAFFAPLAGVAGAAATIALDAAIAADPGRIAAAGVNAPGDNAIARALADLRDARVLESGTATFAGAWGRLVYKAGSDAQVARQDYATRAQVILQVQALRDSVSGVSLDEEAANMLRFQRAYEANARFFTTVDSAIDTLLNMVGR